MNSRRWLSLVGSALLVSGALNSGCRTGPSGGVKEPVSAEPRTRAENGQTEDGETPASRVVRRPPRHPNGGEEPEPRPEPEPGPRPGPGPGPGPQPSGDVLPPDSPVFRYAPTVFLHPDDKYLPMSADTFLANSSLNWNRDQACPDHMPAGKGQINASMLGSGGYTHKWASTSPVCFEYGREFRSNEHTEPGKGVAGGEGFFLNLDNDFRRGLGRGAPVYYEYYPRQFITYWFLYGFNVPPGPEHIDMELFAHEGDWEGISVKLDQNDLPVEVAYFAHGKAPRRVAWSQAPKSFGEHPDVYSAKGSHASYPEAGAHGMNAEGEVPLVGNYIWVNDYTARGEPWRTWNNLRDVRKQAWYGYGGTWGEMCGGLFCASQGPLGPSGYKPNPYKPAPTSGGTRVCPDTRPRCCGVIGADGRCDGICVGRNQYCP